MRRTLILALFILLAAGSIFAQGRKYSVHQRGMLHETIYNTGEIGRTYDQGQAGITKGFPSFEWPGNSATTVDGKYYSGQHNSFGGGMQLSANRRDTVRMYAYCGAISGLPVVGVYSFPLQMTRIENYPLLASGDLNPSYDPNEAEEIIISKWATPIGITVTRTSRAWSHPDYDDFIIYEYELENTGDRDGNPATPAFADTLKEVLVSFAYGLAPGKTGYERKYNRWTGNDFQNNDVYARFDRRRWLSYAVDRDGKPDQMYAAEWAASGKNGGGLQSPQAVGFLQLYYDTTHLALNTQTQMVVASSDAANVWDANNHLKQPFLNRLETSLFSEAKYRVNMDITQSRKNAPHNSLSLFGPDWIGRDAFNVRQSLYFAVGKMMIYGPYILKPGDKIRFSVAEVAGYGAARKEETAAGLIDEGGSCGQNCGESASANAFNPVWNLWDTIRYGLDNSKFGSSYLSHSAFPEYVNSNVVTVREVSDRAIQAYTNNPLVDYDASQYWPERSPDHGIYRVPVIVPAPVTTLTTTLRAENAISWGPQVESFAVAGLKAPFSHYVISRAEHPLGPWKRIDSVGRGDVRYFKNGTYTVRDTLPKVGESFYYSVVSCDSAGNVSGRTNTTLQQLQLPGTNTLETVYVVPNPFIVRSGFSGAGSPEGKIGFYHLPKQCIIRIISYSGQLVETIHHDSGFYSTEYFQVTRNNQLIAPGVYFYVVETPDGSRNHGKFVIIK